MAGKPIMSMWDCPECGENAVLYRMTREQEEKGLPGAKVCHNCGHEETVPLKEEPPLMAYIRQKSAELRAEAARQ